MIKHLPAWSLLLSLIGPACAHAQTIPLELDFQADRSSSRCELTGDPSLNADNLMVRAGTCRVILPYEQYRFCALDRYHLDPDRKIFQGNGSQGCSVKMVESADGHPAWAFDAILNQQTGGGPVQGLISCHFTCTAPSLL